MGEVNRYPPGTFCWIDLGTTDVAGARAFYGGLFGWEFEDIPPGQAGYTICRLDGKDVTGIHEHPEEEGSHWSSYVSVDDVDAMTARARELGASVEMEPLDVGGTARMSVIDDPTGAALSLWQPKGFIGAELVNEVGTWTWNELVTPDLESAKAFYLDLFGWRAQDVPAPIPRAGFTLGELLVGGGHVPAPGEDATPRWTVSFRVADVDQGAEQVGRLGGAVVLPPMDLPTGSFSVVADPTGAAFTITSFEQPVASVDTL